MSTKWQIIILIALGLLTHFAFFGHPNETVFDEVHFGKFVSGYYTREYFFDIHPPLGKLMIAGFAKLFDFKPEFAFGEIGDVFPDKQYLILRFLPALAGALLPVVIYLLAIEMGFAPIYALLGGLLIALDNALLTQSLYILMDAFLLLFGFLSLLFYFKYKNKHKQKYLILFSVFAGLAMSIKWTGLGFLALPLAFEFFFMIKEWRLKDIIKLIPPVIIALALYFSFFAIHLGILNKSGPGDAFMSARFQKTLQGNRYEKDETIIPSNIFQRFIQLNAEMYKANQRLTAEHPYSSPWYTWPFMLRPIYYWVNGDARIYLIGNPIIWWTAATAMFFLIAVHISRFKNFINKTSVFIISGYTLNILPFIGVKRVMFLYHYFTAFIFSTLALIYLMNKWLSHQHDKQKSSKLILGALLALSVITFIFFSPLTYGLKLTPKSYEARIWLDSWK